MTAAWGTARGRAIRWAGFHILLVAAVTTIQISLREYAADDAYIHVRIARHLVDHGVPYFNLGEPIMASSSPAYTVILFLLFSVCGVNLTALAILNAIVTSACAMLLVKFAKRVLADSSFRIDLILSILVVALLLESSITLMETPLAILCLTCGAHFYLLRRSIAFAFLGAAVFVRIELAIFLIGFLGHGLYTRRIRPAGVIPFALLGTAPWVVYQLRFFQTVVPHAVEVKGKVYSLTAADFVMIGCRYLYGPLLAFRLRWLLIAHAVTAPGLLLAGCLRRGSVSRSSARGDSPTGVTPAALLLFLPGAAILAFYAAMRVLLFQWYLPLFLVPMLTGAFLTVYVRRSRLLWLAFSFLVAPALLNLALNASAAFRNPGRYTDFVFGARARQYLEVGRTLQRDHEDATLLTSEIGALGFAFQGTIYDGVGLVSPAALKYHPMAVPEARSHGYIGAIPAEFVREIDPDIIVAYEAFIEDLLRSNVLEGYEHEEYPSLLQEDAAVADPRQLWYGGKIHVFVRAGGGDSQPSRPLRCLDP